MEFLQVESKDKENQQDMAYQFQQIQKRKENLDYREDQLRQAECAFTDAAEKACGSTKPNDVLSLNVGGHRIDAFRRTLCYVENSMLAAKFSGRWDDSLERDRDGNIFIDQPPALFEALIGFFRACANATPHGPPVCVSTFDPTLATDLNFVRMVEYYGCTQVVYPTQISLHRGTSDDDGSSVRIRQYPDMSIEADTWSTFILECPSHGRRIKSYQVELDGDGDKCAEHLLVGLCDADKFAKDFSNTCKGVGENGCSVAFDCCTGDIVYSNGSRCCGRRLEPTNRVAPLSKGSVITVNTTGIGQHRKLESIVVDGVVATTMDEVCISGNLWPAFSAKGSVKVTEIVLDY